MTFYVLIVKSIHLRALHIDSVLAFKGRRAASYPSSSSDQISLPKV